MCALSNTGELYLWGTYKDNEGFLGYSKDQKTEQAVPRIFPGLEGIFFIFIFISFYFLNFFLLHFYYFIIFHFCSILFLFVFHLIFNFYVFKKGKKRPKKVY